MKKYIFIILPIAIISIFLLNNACCFASGFGAGFNSGLIPDRQKVADLDTPINRIWGTISLVLKMLAIAGIIITGIRYMFSTFEVKSKIKECLPTLIIGIIIVFAGTSVIDFVIKVTEEVVD